MRVFLTIDEANPLKPVPELHINGYTLQMSELELRGLQNEIQWALHGISEARRLGWANLATKYKEVQQCEA